MARMIEKLNVEGNFSELYHSISFIHLHIFIYIHLDIPINIIILQMLR